MSLSLVADILRVGMSGFAFLLAFLSYRLLSTEQQKERPRAPVLRASRSFMFACIALVIIVGVLGIATPLLQPRPKADEVARCKDSMSFIEAKLNRRSDLPDLSNAVSQHLKECANAFP